MKSSVATAASSARPHDRISPVYSLLERRGNLLAAAFLVVFFALALHKSHAKPLWFDEYFTAIVAMQPDWHHFLGSLPPEGNPPLNTLLTRWFFQLFGVSIFSLRLAPMLGYTASLAGLYVFVRRELGALYGFLAVGLMIAEPSWQYAFEARPYGLMLAFFMLALTGWQAAAHAVATEDRKSRGWALAAMTVGIAGCILAHDIGLMEIGIPLLFGEIVRTWQRRRLDWPVLATALVTIPAMSIVLPMMRNTRRVALVHADVITSPYTIAKLWRYAAYGNSSLGLVISSHFVELLLAVIVVVWVLQGRSVGGAALLRSNGVPPTGSRLSILAASFGALILIPLAWLAMIPSGGWFFSRYGIGSVIGISLSVCFLLSKGRASRTLVLLLLVVCGAAFAHRYRRYKPEFGMDMAAWKTVTEDTTGLPIVLSNGLFYPQIWWYAPKSVQSRLFFLQGPTKRLGLVEAGLLAERPYIAAPVETVDEFVAKYNRALVYRWPDGKTLLQQFQDKGFEVLPQGGNLYEVRR